MVKTAVITGIINTLIAILAGFMISRRFSAPA